jgi:glycosyltransferase involved in cell wall biosynthesis
MKILYLTFYFEPDLCAGSFRNTSLVKSLSRALGNSDIIDVMTTYPNRYQTYRSDAPAFEKKDNIQITRIHVPRHKSGFLDQMNTFVVFFFGVKRIVKKRNYDLVFASSSRLFTAYLGYTIAYKKNIPLYLDIRDIFVDTMEDILKNKIFKSIIIPIIKIIEKKTMNNACHINLVSGGFLHYFKKFTCNSYSNFPNGIDDEFLNLPMSDKKNRNTKTYTILYAGNIGECQGLEKIIPPAACMLGNDYRFIIIGDGGAKKKLEEEIAKENLKNVEIRNPLNRNELVKLYDSVDYLFLHLNEFKAFEKVLPSKIFELAACNKPIIAGVSGFSYEFIKENISNVILFRPCDVNDLVGQLKYFRYNTGYRYEFVEKFKRNSINKKMAQSILEIIS